MAYGTITNTIQDPSGTPVPNVVVNARLMPGPGFLPTTYYEMSTLETTTTDVNGAWTLSLEVNTDISPGDSYYEIEELIPASAGVPTVWSVQVAAGSHTLYASLVSTPPSQSVPSYITQSSGDARYIQTGGDVGGNIQPVGTATITGTATVGAPANHAHVLSPAVVGSGLALTAGVLSTVGPGAIGGLIQAVGTGTATGTSTAAAADNHVHPLNPSVIGSGLSLAAGVILGPIQGSRIQAVGTMTVTGTATSWATDNHAHVLSPAVAGTGLTHAAGVLSVTTPLVLGGAQDITAVNTATATGTATTVAASNHQHPLSPSIVGTGLTLNAGVLNAALTGSLIQAVGTSTQTGTSTAFARENHVHILSPAIVGNDLALAAGVLSVSPRVPLVGSLIQAVNTTTQTGTSTAYARENHVHIISPDIVGSGLTLTNGVLSAPPAGLSYGGAQDITAVETATATGTATTVARANHQHPLSPNVIGSGLLLTSGVASVSGLTNSNASSTNLFIAVSTATGTVGLSQGQIVYNSASTAVMLSNGTSRINTTPQSATVATSETTTSNTYTDLSTSGPAVTLLTGTKALVIITAINICAAGQSNYMSLAVSGATTVAASDANGTRIGQAGVQPIGTTNRTFMLTGLTPGLNTFTAKYRTDGVSAATFSNRDVTVIGIP